MANLTKPLSFAAAICVLLGSPSLVAQRARPPQQGLPMGRQHGLASLEAQQRHVQGLLQARYRVTDGRLAAVQRFGGLRKAPAIDHRRQHCPLFDRGPGENHYD